MDSMLVYKKWTIIQELNKYKFLKMDKNAFNVGFKLTLLASLMSVLKRHHSTVDIKGLQ